jgi:RNA dependent RNA polymerase
LRRLKLVTIAALEVRGEEKGDKGMADFFRYVTDGIVLCASEAKNMSGGDFDGDEVWISTNKDLLACMPEAIDANSWYDDVPLEMLSGAEGQHWTKSTVYDQLDYALNFRYHRRELGKLSNCLEQYADLYGFDHSDTQKIGKAAFLQVRAHKLLKAYVPNLNVHSSNQSDYPYIVSGGYAFQGTKVMLMWSCLFLKLCWSDTVIGNDRFDAFEHMLDMKDPSLGPDWKKDSKNMLGKLYKTMTERIVKLGKERKGPQVSKDSSGLQESKLTTLAVLEKFISDHAELGEPGDMEECAKSAATKYVRVRQRDWDKEEGDAYAKWKTNFCMEERKQLSAAAASVDSKDYQTAMQLLAAIVHKECVFLDKTDTHPACEFAWAAFEQELLEVFSGPNRRIVSQQGMQRIASRPHRRISA